MKRQIAFILMLILTFHATASFADSVMSAQDVVYEIKYEALTVSDEASLKEVMQKHSVNLRKMMAEMSPAERSNFQKELMEHADPRMARDLNQLSKVINLDKMNDEQRAEVFATLISKGNEGASWDLKDTGALLFGVTIGVVVLSLMANAVSCGIFYEKVFGWENKPGC